MDRLIFRSVFTALVLVVLFCVPSIASADGITWTFSGVTFDDGGTLSGSFVFDAVGLKYSAISVASTTGITLTGATYTSLSSLGSSSATGLLFGASSGDLTSTSVLSLLFDVALTNSGGIVQLSTLPPNDSVEGFCTNSDCSTFSTRSVTGGEVVGTVVTPEPPVISLLGLGLIALLAGAAVRKLSYA